MFRRLKRRLAEEFQKRRHARLYEKYRRYTMVPKRQFIQNLDLASACSRVDGSVVECGVWRGGMIAAISEVMGSSREYYLFDSFQGLPAAGPIDGIAAQTWQHNRAGSNYHANCRAEPSSAREAMLQGGVQSFKIIPGWFQETLSRYPATLPIALLRLDGDWFASTLECLIHLYPRVAPAGLIIIDDYYTWEGCARAVHEYLATHSSPDRLRHTSHGVCYIRKQPVSEIHDAPLDASSRSECGKRGDN